MSRIMIPYISHFSDPNSSNTSSSIASSMSSSSFFQPDACRSYYEYGYCGFEDHCTFSHNAFSENEQKSKYDINSISKSSSFSTNSANTAISMSSPSSLYSSRIIFKPIPVNISNSYPVSSGKTEEAFNCKLCNSDLFQPIITNCKHIFCESCMMKYYINISSNCVICDKELDGNFIHFRLNDEEDNIRGLKRKRERKRN